MPHIHDPHVGRARLLLKAMSCLPVLFAIASGPPARAASAPAKANATAIAKRCAADEELLFHCVTDHRAELNLCVNAPGRSVRLLRYKNKRTTVVAQGLPQQKVQPARLDNTEIRWGVGRATKTLTVENDIQDPTVDLTGDNDAPIESCKGGRFDVGTGRERAPGGAPLGIFSLPDFGLSRPMSDAPSRP